MENGPSPTVLQHMEPHKKKKILNKNRMFHTISLGDGHIGRNM
jgi:hypothetical protein